uniref:Helicase ATP-binding domain-containing protein n=1 Tax=viral metagenome TaxID=1070528 RepID=A0A6C0HSI7_9ZZZZ
MEYPENNENSPNQELLKNEIAQKEVEEKLDDLENLIKENAILGYNANCVRKKSNWSKSSQIYRFDNPEFNPEIFLKDMPDYSPKLNSLMHKIEQLDKEDKRKHGKLFKHFIFSDLKSSAYGAKMIASAFIAKGYTLGYEAKPKNNIVGGEDPKGPEKKRYRKIELLEDDVLQQTLQNNFYILSSVGVYDQPIPVILKKEMLKKYNQRPENIQGENIRFIILDSGFKEGIDLFDIKYIHIFEPSIVSADQKQVIGRGTRTCGQKGLDFHPTQGWILNVFVYDLSIPEKLQKGFLNTKSTMELYFKSMDLDIRLINFAHDLERTTVLGSVDYELNKNVHSFSIPFISADEEEDRVLLDEHVKDDVELLYGGSDIIPKKRKLIVRPGPPINRPLQGPLGFDKMREFIRDNYGEFSWDKVKMENLCDEKNQKGGNIIKYTPTQDFIRHYFNPAFPMKGMLLQHSVGTGKTCSAIAAATQNFEKNGYTILWVTRTTLKSDIWKNMFDQICNETIRNMIKKENLEIPNDQQKRMRLLSKAWRIRPMSYKQFSNLILRQNALYDTLVKINGKEDPLRKTLLVIDEAHKLYGGDDLSSIEKPDMNALHQALMYSYQYSGADSVRLLLMTATPITKDPMELIQLLNLCKPAEQQMPADFSNFSTEYLNENGEFTDQGRKKYLDDIAGLVSYLNREKDARQFSQPQIHYVNTPIISDIKMAEKFDKKLVQDLLDTNVSDLREQIQEENEKLEGELGQVNAEKFAFLKDEICGDKNGPSKSQCVKIVNAGIRDMVLEAKDQVKDVREKIKEIRERIKERGQMKKTALAEVKENIEKYADQYEKYKSSLLYELKDSCAIKIGDKTTLDEKLHEHPVIHKYDLLIKEYNDEIKDLDQQLKNLTINYKKRMEHLKHLLKTDLNDVERSVVNSTIRDEQKEYGSMIRLKRRETEKAEKVIKTNISNIEKKRTQRYNKIRKTVKNMITNEKQRIREYKQEKKMLRKTMKSQQKNIKHDFLKGLINKYRSKILEDLVDIDKNNIVKNENKIAEKEEKEKMKVVKKAAKEEERIQKENNKTMKKREKEEDKNRKMREKEMEKTRKNREKEEDKNRKNKEKEEEKARKMREKEMKRNKK